MLMKERTKSTTHLILESLNNRMNLSFEDKMNYQNQMKGIEGECLFDQLINHPLQTGFVINDLLLSTKNTYYQIDALLILNGHINIYEVKNYTGNYTLEDDTMSSESGHLIQNPLNQVSRKKAYLHNLLLNLGYQYTVSAYVAYVNPDFYIYSMPPTKSILFHGQLKKHFQQLPQHSKKKSTERQNKKVAEFLVSQHHEDYRPNHLLDYTFNDLKKGITCPECFSFHFSKTRSFRTCTSCGDKEKIADAIYRSILKFQLLFPEIPVTLRHIFIWCGSIYSEFRVRDILNIELTKHPKGTETYYT